MVGLGWMGSMDLIKVEGRVTFVCVIYHLWDLMLFDVDCQYHTKLGLVSWFLGCQVLGKSEGMGTVSLG